ncbi:MAG: hypothetical protein WCP55_06795 [Lentisphaerota bacterium]
MNFKACSAGFGPSAPGDAPAKTFNLFVNTVVDGGTAVVVCETCHLGHVSKSSRPPGDYQEWCLFMAQ